MMSIRNAVRPRIQPFLQRSLQKNSVRPMTVLSKSSAEEYKKQNYSERMNKTGRPVSPHVTIYAFPVSAIASITTRVTGVILSFGAFGIGALDLMVPGAALGLMESIGSSGFLVASGAKAAVAFPLVYHSLGAFRHFVWDYYPDKFLYNADVEKSSIGILGASGLITLGCMVV